MTKHSFKKCLRQTREKQNLSQTQLAQMLNVNITTYRNYENTNREPDYDTLIRISDILGVSIDYLLGRSNITNLDLPKDKEELLLLYDSLSQGTKKTATDLMRTLAFPSPSENKERA